MEKLITILSIIFVISMHELGHYFAMRKIKVEVEEIAIGVGPKLFQKQLKNTKFTIRLGFVLGGYVLPKNSFDIQKSQKHSLPQKMFAFSAGIVVNLIIAIIFKCIFKILIFNNIYFAYINVFYYISYISWVFACINILPVLGITDGAKIINLIIGKCIKNKVLGITSAIICNIIGTIVFIYLYWL